MTKTEWNKPPSNNAPSFPPPPLVPIRDRGTPRQAALARMGPPNPRVSPPRLSNDSDVSSAFSDAGSPPQATRGLRPPPPLHARKPLVMPTIPGSPITKDDDKEEENISPLLSRAPPAPGSPPPTATSPSSPTDDVIPAEHKRIPARIPRSPLSPLSPISILTERGREFGLGIMARRGGGRKPVPPPIIIHPPPRGSVDTVEREVDIKMSPPATAVSMTATIIRGGQSPVVVEVKKSKRKTVWGMIEGWWDLGLLERMGTVRRKK